MIQVIIQVISLPKTSRLEKSVDSDQLASEKPADLDLDCFQNRLYPHLAW